MIRLNTSNLDDTIKDLESKLTERPDAIFSKRDVTALKKRIVKKALTGQTGFLFRVDYAPTYRKQYAKAPGNYMKQSGKMLNVIKVEEEQNGLDRSFRIVIPDYMYPGKTYSTADVARWHNTGTASGGKIRHWFDLSKAEQQAIDRTVKKRIEKLLNEKF